MVPKMVYFSKQYMQKLCFIALTPRPLRLWSGGGVKNILSNII